MLSDQLCELLEGNIKVKVALNAFKINLLISDLYRNKVKLI